MKIGIIKEGKTPVDRRVAFTPLQCKTILQLYPKLTIVIEPSDIRCYSDQEYLDCGIALQKDLTDCDVLFGVKEVPLDALIEKKVYFFFSHTIKKQTYNQALLQTVIQKKIQLVDYECLTDVKDVRVVAFGRYAGIVGAYNALRAYGLKKNAFDLKPAYKCLDMNEIFIELRKININTLKIVLTGGGRVAQGAMEILDEAKFIKVAPNDLKWQDRNSYIQLDAYEYNERIDGESFSYDHFFANPTEYKSTFNQYLSDANVFIAGAYWDPKAPILFDKKHIKDTAFNFEVIADITCDINGSVPTTIRSSTIESPFYDINVNTLQEELAFSNPQNISVMAVDNLPCELPRDASTSFGEQLMTHVIPVLADKIHTDIIEKASICKNGVLTKRYEYLTDYLENNILI